MHRLETTIVIIVFLVAPLAHGQESADPGECVVARAPVAATANGALDLDAFGPSDAPSSPAARGAETDSSPAVDASMASVDAESDAPIDAEINPTAAMTVARNPRSVVPKGPRVTRDAKGRGEVPWYRTPYMTLLAVLGLIVAASVLFKRWVPAARQVSPETMRVLGRVALAAKHSAVLLHVGRRVVLVGLSADAVSTLAEISDPDEVAALLGQSVRTDSSAGFEKTLAREIEAYPEQSEADGDAVPVDAELLEKTQGQLHGLLSKLRAMQGATSV